MRAAFRGHVEIMRLLIAKGANVNAETGKSPEHLSVLDFAADGGQVEAAALLIEKGADIRHLGDENKTPLHHAVNWGGGTKGSKELAELLIKKGADINAKGWEEEYTPLMIAALNGNREIVEMLIANGADIDAKSKSGSTALQIAAGKRHQDVVELLRAKGAIDPAQTTTRVPAWNAAGLGALAWQGISCIHMTGDGSYVAVGTLAPLADPNVFLIDAGGKIVEQHAVGVQSIGEIAAFNTGPGIAAICTAPTGKVYDDPALFRFLAGALAGPMDADFLPLLFQYGEHSNHYARALVAGGEGFALTTPRGIRWQSAGAAGESHFINTFRSIGVRVSSIAGTAAGGFVVGTVVNEKNIGPGAQNVFVVDDRHPGTRWMRDPLDMQDVEPAAPLAPGPYGPTTQTRDDQIWAPLSVAIDGSGNQVASADYQGYERFVLPRSAEETLKPMRSLGVRFTSSRPTIHVYDGQGKQIRKFSPSTFDGPLWSDLVFSADGADLLAYPHHWTSRGLAGQPCLPADEEARTLYFLSVKDGNVHPIRFPDLISDVATAGKLTAVACWNGRVYLLGPDHRRIDTLPNGLDVGAAGVLAMNADGSRIVVGTALGVVHMLDGGGRELWKNDLAKNATPGKKPWTAGVASRPIAPGIWLNNTGRDPSDAGTQIIIAAPTGLILVDPNSGHSFEQNWAMIKGAGLDPTQVKYVIATHEHGDHAPGAALWRVVTGAKMISTPEMAYTLQHDLPVTSGYSFDPPVPADILIHDDIDMDLCGLKVRLLRLPGHTYGSMGLFFEMGGRRYVCTGDLIMGGGGLGWAGSPNFWPPDVLASLKKLDALKPDYVITGHGHGEPDKYIGAGLRAADATGWGRMPPAHPNPTFGFTDTNYQVVAWREVIYCAAFGDIDGDGLPDIAIVTPGDHGLDVKIYLNKKGHFDEKPNHIINLADVDPATRIGLLHLTRGKIADLLVTTESRAVLLAAGNDGAWKAQDIGASQISDPNLPHGFIFAADSTTQPPQFALIERLGVSCRVLHVGIDGSLANDGLTFARPAIDLQFVDLNGDGRADLITSGGEIFLRSVDGRLPGLASVTLDHPYGNTTYLAIADFNGDGKPDIVQIGMSGLHEMAAVFYNTGNPSHPFKPAPDTEIDLGQRLQPLGIGPTAADLTGDGIADLIIGQAQHQEVLIIPGSKSGLELKNALHLKLDYRLNSNSTLSVLDLEGNGKRSIAGFGTSPVGAAGVYIRLPDPPGRN